MEKQEWQGYVQKVASCDLGFENWHRVNETTICQCTGLSDKTGEIIFKNDIVDFLGHRGIVKFECGSFGIAYEKHIF